MRGCDHPSRRRSWRIEDRPAVDLNGQRRAGLAGELPDQRWPRSVPFQPGLRTSNQLPQTGPRRDRTRPRRGRRSAGGGRAPHVRFAAQPRIVTGRVRRQCLADHPLPGAARPNWPARVGRSRTSQPSPECYQKPPACGDQQQTHLYGGTSIRSRDCPTNRRFAPAGSTGSAEDAAGP